MADTQIVLVENAAMLKRGEPTYVVPQTGWYMR